MNIHKNILNKICENKFDDFESLLNNKDLNLCKKSETNILMECINHDRLKFFENMINFKKNHIYYFNFSIVLKNIIQKEYYNYIKIILNIKNINFYLSFDIFLNLFIELGKYELLRKVIENDLINLNNSFYSCELYKIIEIDDYNCVDILLKKSDYDDIPLEHLYSCHDDIFKLFINDILKKNNSFLDINYEIKNILNLNNNNKYGINITKFDYIYDLKKEEYKNSYLEFTIYQSFIENNVDLFNYFVDSKKYNLEMEKIVKIIKKFDPSNKRSIIYKTIYNCTKDTSTIIYNKLKDTLNIDVNLLIERCIICHNCNILDKIELNHKINKKRIERILLSNYNLKYIDNKVIYILLNKFEIKNNKKFIVEYLNLLLNNNDKVLLMNLINSIKDEKIIKLINDNIKKTIKNDILIDRIVEGDIYDWYFIEWINIKFEDIKLFSSCIDIIKDTTKSYEPNIHFIYWYMNQDLKFFEEDDFNEILIRLHSNFDRINKLMIDNIDKDYILLDKIKDLLKRSKDDTKRNQLLKSIFHTKSEISQIEKIENIDDEMKDIFNKFVYKDLKFFTNLMKDLLLNDKANLIDYIFDKIKNLRISSYKLISNFVIINKNYYLMDKFQKKIINKDSDKYYNYIINRSIIYLNFITFEWAYKKLSNSENFNTIDINNNINKLLKNININSQINDSYIFLIKIYDYLSITNKKLIYRIIFSNFGKNKLIMEDFLDNIIDFNSYDKLYKYDIFNIFISNVDRFNINHLIKKLNITEEDYIDFRNNYHQKYNNAGDFDNDNYYELKFNLLQRHDIEFIFYLNECGLEIKFGNDILLRLFNSNYFNKRTNVYLNNMVILKMIKDLASKNMFDINLQTLNIFLENYNKIKYKISLEEVKDLINENNLEINYETLYHSSNSKIKDIFQYLKNLKEIDLKENDEELLLQVCLNNDVEFAKYLLEIEPAFNVSKNNDNIFSQCCNEGALDSIKWLYQIIPNMYEKTKYEYSICGACYYGHLNVAKWLYSNIENLDIKVDDDYCMVNAIEFEYYDMIDWIMEIEPNRYNIRYNEDSNYTEIVSFEINKKLVIDESKKVETILECPICFDKNSNIITCCNHQFCYNCFSEYYKKNTNICCPYCRKDNIKLFNIK